MRVIDYRTWDRRPYYEMFEGFRQPYYSVTVECDVTALVQKTRARKQSFYAACAWLCTRAFNGIEAFRYRQRGTDIVVIDGMDTLLAVMAPGDPAFRQIRVPLTPAFAEYEQLYRVRAADTAAPPVLPPRTDGGSDALFSSLPWFSFTGLEAAKPDTPDVNEPLVTFGRYRERDGRLLMPLALQLNHWFVQGNDLAAFLAALDRGMAAF